MKHLRTTRVTGVVAVGAITALLVTGCTRGADTGGGGGESGEEEASPGITDTTLNLGISSALSGPNAGPGTCTVAGLYTYLEAGNADGGFEFGDGNTRTVELTYLDDAFDPARTVANFRQMVDDGIFAYVGGFATPGNAAIQPVANEEEVPQVLIMTGATQFSADQEAFPWTLGLLPTYYDEGFAYGQFLVDQGATTVAILQQNDDYGEDYVRGFEEAIDGSDVEIVAQTTSETSDATLDSQVTQLAASNAEQLMSIVSVTPLQVGVLTKAQSLGWLPGIFLPSNTSTPATIVVPGNGAAYPAIYTTSSSKAPASPAFADDEDVIAYNEQFPKYGAAIAPAYTPHCSWSYAEGAILAEVFKAMTEPTRDNFMEALHSIDGFQAPLIPEGIVVNTTELDQPALRGLNLAQYNGTAYGPVTQ